jgi:phage terminase large subunit GpA-like protein
MLTNGKTLDSWEGPAWRPPPELKIDEWSEQTISLPRSIAEVSGPLSWEVFPPAREILRAATEPGVEEITMCFPAQTCKTLIVQCILLYFLAEEGVPCLHVVGRELDAVSLNVDRYQRIIQESPKLRAMLTGAAHDMVRDAIRLNGSTLFFRGANSPAALSMHSIAKLATDETDKYEEFTGREADPISLARERTERYSNRLILKTSTPTTPRGYIWVEYLAGDRRSLWVPCPRCNFFQRMVMGNEGPGPGIKIPDGMRDPERIVQDNLAWYECEKCARKILDIDKPAMLRPGLWVPEKQKIDQSTGRVTGDPPPRRHLSYQISRVYSPFPNSTFSRVIAEFLKSKPFPMKLMNFRNSWMAEIWEDTVDKLEGEVVRTRSREGDYAQTEIPARAQIMTAGVDVQGDHIWYVIRAWGPGGESWLIRCGRLGSGVVTDFDALAGVLFRAKYKLLGSRNGVPLKLVFMDVGFAARKDEVLRFCERHGCQPVRGDSEPTMMLRQSKITDSQNRSHPLLLLDTHYFKSKLHRLIRINPADPGAWHLPRNLEEAYFLQMAVEQRVLETDKRSGRTRHVWKVFPSGADNHLFDAEVYALAAAEHQDVENQLHEPVPSETSESVPQPHPQETTDQTSPIEAYRRKTASNRPKPKRIQRTTCRIFR